MLYRFPYDDHCEAIMLYESRIAKHPNVNTLKQKTTPHKETVCFNGETGVGAFNKYAKERYMFEDFLKMLKSTSPMREVVVPKEPVKSKNLIMYERYACNHLRERVEKEYHAVYFLGLQGTNAYVGYDCTIYKVAVSSLYTI